MNRMEKVDIIEERILRLERFFIDRDERSHEFEELGVHQQVSMLKDEIRQLEVRLRDLGDEALTGIGECHANTSYLQGQVELLEEKNE